MQKVAFGVRLCDQRHTKCIILDMHKQSPTAPKKFMIAKTLYRKPIAEEEYAKYLKSRKVSKITDCVFCDQENMVLRNLDNNLKYVRLIRPTAPYDYWDEREVLDHLMIIPIRHLSYISEFDDKETKEYFSLIGKYFQPQYSVFARSYGSVADHLHIHIFKVSKHRLEVSVQYKAG